MLTISARGEGRTVAVGARRLFLEGLAPIQSSIHHSVAPVANFLRGTVWYGSTFAESTRLRRELIKSYSQDMKDAVSEQQAGEVLKQAHLPFAAAVPAIAAEIATPGWSNFSATVTINKGASAGVRNGEPVLASGGLAGRVVAVSGNAAIVELVTDVRSVVNVRLGDGYTGVAQGRGSGRNLALTVAGGQRQTSALKRGMVLVTSGLAMGTDPPGIPVGDVVSTERSAATVQVRPFVTSSILPGASVKVLRWSWP